MRFFIDTADLTAIDALLETGMIDGVTTNPSLIAQSGGDILEVIRKICAKIKGPVSAEVTARDYATMMREADKLRGTASNIAIKVPLTRDGLRACRRLSDEGTMVNVTLCFSAAQALLAAKAGATFISPFVGRMDDHGKDGMELIEDIIEMYSNYPEFETQVLVASVRTPQHVERAAVMGADIATLPPRIIEALYKHPLTDKGLAAFEADWVKTGQSIL